VRTISPKRQLPRCSEALRTPHRISLKDRTEFETTTLQR
jgi:hypothetical protein